MAKKAGIILLAIGLLTPLLSFAGGGQESTGSEAAPAVVNLLVTSGTAAQFKAVAPIFEQDHPGVKIEISAPGWAERYTKIVTTMPVQPESLDIVGIGNDEMPGFTEGDWLVDITLPDELVNDMLPGAKELLAYKGKTYGIPWSLATKVFFYNEAMLKEAGFNEQPATWDELVDMTKAMQNSGSIKHGILFGWKDVWVDYPIFSALEGLEVIIDQEGYAKFDNAQGIRAVQYMKDLMVKEKVASPSSVSYTDHEVMTSFLGRQTPFQLHWPFIAAMIDDPEQSKIVGEGKVGLMPGNSSRKSSSVIGTMGLAVSSGSKHRDIAKEFVLFTGRRDIHKKMVLVSKEVPILESVVDDPEVQADNPLMLLMAEQFRYSVDMPKVIWWGEIRPLLNDNINKGVAGTASPEDAVRMAAEQINEVAEKRQ